MCWHQARDSQHRMSKLLTLPLNTVLESIAGAQRWEKLLTQGQEQAFQGDIYMVLSEKSRCLWPYAF